MSKRFGRNQKRRMREQFAAQELEQAENIRILTESYSAALGKSKGLLKRAEDTLNVIRQELGENSALFDVKDQRNAGVYSDMQGFLWNVLDRPVCLSPQNLKHSIIDVQNFQRVTIHLLQTKAISDHFRLQLHMRVGLAGKDFAYGISGIALMKMTKETLYRQIFPELATSLIRQIQETGVRI